MTIDVALDSIYMLDILPCLLRSWEGDGTMPHARVPPPPAGPGRGVTRTPPGSWLTREPLYKAPSGHPVVATNNTLLHTDIPIPWLARTGPWESRSLRDVRRIQSLPARVKTGDHVFGECYQHDYSVLLLPVHGSTRYCSWSDRCATGRSEHLHCFLSALHRAGQLHRQVLCRLAPAWMPLGIIYCLLFIIWSTYLHTMID
jgi:hypothetical protein